LICAKQPQLLQRNTGIFATGAGPFRQLGAVYTRREPKKP